jgi:hypothetical protein
VASFLQDSLWKPCKHVSSPPFVTHVPSVSTSIISSSNVWRGVNIMKFFPLLHPLETQAFSSSSHC